MVAPTVTAIARPPIQASVSRVHKRRGRLYAAVQPGVTTRVGPKTGTVAGTLSIAVPVANYPRATTLHATAGNGGALPAWLTQDWASNTLTLSKAGAAGTAGTYLLRIVAQDGAGNSAFDPFILTLT